MAAVSCSKDVTQAGGLEVIVATNLQESAFDQVHLEISQETGPGEWNKLVDRTALVPSEVTLPTTASIAAGSASDQKALIRVSALAHGQVLVERVAQVQVPRDRLVQFPMLLAARCVGQLGFCSEGESCQPDTGKCGSNVVEPTNLPPYVPGNEARRACIDSK
jgi:hypothetical protein